MTNTKWNKYPNKKPKEDGYYLCTIDTGYRYEIGIIRYMNKGKENEGWYSYYAYYGEWQQEDDETILAWMELPKPYKEEL